MDRIKTGVYLLGWLMFYIKKNAYEYIKKSV